MATTIKGQMSRKDICQQFGIHIKTLGRRLDFHFKELFKGRRLFSPKEVALIADTLDLWPVTIPD